MDYNTLIKMIEEDSITPYSFYNTDINSEQYWSIKYYLENHQDTIEIKQDLNTVMSDIEVYNEHSKEFPEAQKAEKPISAITIYNNFKEEYISYFLVLDHVKDKIDKTINEYTEIIKNILTEDKYLEKNETLKLEFFEDETELIEACWSKIHEYDPTVLSGYNSHLFDYPYIYNRLKRLYSKKYIGKDKNEIEKEISKTLSKIGLVKPDRGVHNEYRINFPEYCIMDILNLYRPRAMDQSSPHGLNYGKTQSSYTLDYISETLLGTNKLAYKDTGLSLDRFYDTDPINYLLYNIIDVVLVKKLNEKLKHIELHNLIRRFMRVSLSYSMRGSSALFDTFVLYRLSESSKYVRFGIVDENYFKIFDNDLKNIQLPKTKEVKNWKIETLDNRDIKKYINKFPGAYVKETPIKNIFLPEDGVIGDLDASSLYPSVICQYNISFDTYKAKLIDPVVYGSLNMLNQYLGTNEPIPQGIFSQLWKHTENYVNCKGLKKEEFKYVYYIISWLFNKLKNINRPLQNLLNPDNYQDYQILRKYLLSLIDMIEEIHSKSFEVNTFVYDYLINDDISNQPDDLYIITNPLQPSLKVSKINKNDLMSFIKDNNYIFTITGNIFDTHDAKEGLYTEFLIKMKKLRNKYKNTRDTFQEYSDEYNFWDSRQTTVKIVSNSLYGLLGLGTFRFSNKNMAATVTVSGRHFLKIAQVLGDYSLEQFK